LVFVSIKAVCNCFDFKGMIACSTLESAAARPPFTVRLAPCPQGSHGQIRARATAWNVYRKGCARRITIARKASAKGATLEFNGQNLAQVVGVSDSHGGIRCYLRAECAIHGSKFPLVPSHYSRILR